MGAPVCPPLALSLSTAGELHTLQYLALKIIFGCDAVESAQASHLLHTSNGLFAFAVSLPCTIELDSPAAVCLKAELQVLLAELKRLGLQQQQLQQDAQALDADRKPRKGNTAVAFNLPLLPHHAVLRQSTYGSSNWSEDTAETPPARNIISGVHAHFITTITFNCKLLNAHPQCKHFTAFRSTFGRIVQCQPTALPSRSITTQVRSSDMQTFCTGGLEVLVLTTFLYYFAVWMSSCCLHRHSSVCQCFCAQIVLLFC